MKSRTTLRAQKTKASKMSAADRHWTRGYATALATAYRNHHDRCTVVHAMRGDGITIEMLEQADVDDYDLVEIRSALGPRKWRARRLPKAPR